MGKHTLQCTYVSFRFSTLISKALTSKMIALKVGRLSAKPDRDVLMQDFAEVETVSFPRLFIANQVLYFF